MKYIEKVKWHKKVEILICLVVMVVTYFIWSFEDITKSAAFYLENSMITIATNKQDGVPLLASSSGSTVTFTLTNGTYRKEDYKLYLGVLKDDYEGLNVIDLKNNEEKDISFADDVYVYYFVDENTLQAAQRKYDLTIVSKIPKRVEVKVLLEKVI